MTRKHLSRSAVLVVLALLSTSSLVTAQDDTGDGPNIAFFMASASNTFSQAQVAGATEVIEAAGGTIQTFDGAFDATTQVNAMQNALASGEFDGFIVLPNQAQALVPPVEDAIAEGVKVAAVYAPVGPDLGTLEPQVEGITVTVGPSLAASGEGIAQLIVEACADRDPCEAAFMPGFSTDPADIIRQEALEETVAQHPNIELVIASDGQFLADPAFQSTQNLLTTHPDIDVIATGGDQMTQGAELAVADAGLTDQVALIGNGASKPGVQAVNEGRWFGTYVQLPHTEGKVAAESILAALAGETPPKAVLVTELSPVGPVCTPANCADFEGEWEG